MKKLTIGKNPSCDIIIDNPKVSRQHACLTFFDDGTASVKDLNSTNGTFVNGQRISGDTVLSGSDELKVADSVVNWRSYKSQGGGARHAGGGNTLRIGRTSDNDIVVSYPEVSGHHATLTRNFDGSTVLTDNGSTNGTFVNGVRISSQILRPGDKVTLAGKFPVNWESAFGGRASGQGGTRIGSVKKQGLTTTQKIVWSAVAVVIALVVCVVAVKLTIKKAQKITAPVVAVEETLTPEQVYSKYNKSIVLIYHAYVYQVCIGDEVIDQSDPVIITGTGFFVSEKGDIITNRHVACPWDADKETTEKIRRAYQDKITTGALYVNPYLLKYVNDVKVTGSTVKMGIIVNDTRANTTDDLIGCSFVCAASEEDIDLARLQVNTKTLPAGVSQIVSLQDYASPSEATEGTEVFSMGFPAGFSIGSTPEGIKANCQDGKITQKRGEKEFGHNIPTTGGASGSPIFDNKGRLIGVVYAGYTKTQGYNLAIHAKYAADLLF